MQRKCYFYKMKDKRIIGIDPGIEESGIVVLDGSNIIGAFNVKKEQFYSKVTEFSIHSNINVAVEDLAAYSLRLTPQVISTAKFVGEAEYRLKNEFRLDVSLIPRSLIKRWCFDTFPVVCIPIIEAKIKKKGQVIASTGEPRKPHFVYVDDKIVMECMKSLYKVASPGKGRKYEYGLNKHSWQALAVASYYKSINGF
jgi:hypothetical protein